MTAAAFLAFTALVVFAAVSPGPAVLMSARTGLTEGFRTGLMLAMGIGAGAVVWAAAAMFGLNIVFAAAPALLWVLKIAGGLYLVWMAVQLWRHARVPLVIETARALPRSPAAAFRRGLFTQLANPKPAVMFSAIFLGTVPPQTPLWVYLTLLAIIFVAETLWNSTVARVFSLDRSRATYIALKTVIDRSFGGLLALLGVKVAFS
ncbi:MAG: LysE family translocator [Gemmobacter sp.]